MKKEFIPYEQALALKELGFDENCFGLWNLNNGKYEVDIIGVCQYSKEFKYREVLAPLYQQAFRWFREKYNYWSYVYPSIRNKTWHFHIQFYDSDMWGEMFLGENYTTYEEAELACLIKLIEIVKENKQ